MTTETTLTTAKLKGRWRKGSRGRRRSRYEQISVFLEGATKRKRFSGEQGKMDGRMDGGNQAAARPFPSPSSARLSPSHYWWHSVAALLLFQCSLPLSHPPLVWGQASSLQGKQIWWRKEKFKLGSVTSKCFKYFILYRLLLLLQQSGVNPAIIIALTTRLVSG